MKTLMTILFAFLLITIHAQETLDTIYANSGKNVALFFEKPIRHAISGAPHFVFTYNRASEQYFGLLQAQPGDESNLLIVTSDGQIYSYILKFRERLSKLNYFINNSESIGNERRPDKKKLEVVFEEDTNRKNRTTYFQKFSSYLLRTKLEKLASTRRNGMKLHLKKLVYNRSEVYAVLHIENASGIDFEMDYVKIYSVSGNKKRKASFQKLEMEQVYRYKFLPVIRNKESKQFVLVLPKFVLTGQEKLQFELKELNGNRKLTLNYKQ